MLNKKRISLTVGFSVFSEVVNKLLPLYLVHFAQKTLGVPGLGFAQFGITVIEITIPFITFGYNNYGIVKAGQIKDDPEAVGRLIGKIMLMKL